MQRGLIVHIFLILGLGQRDQLVKKYQRNDTIYRPIFWKIDCIVGSERYSYTGTNCNYVFYKYSETYGKSVSCFRHSAKDIVLQQALHKKIDIQYLSSK